MPPVMNRRGAGNACRLRSMKTIRLASSIYRIGRAVSLVQLDERWSVSNSLDAGRHLSASFPLVTDAGANSVDCILGYGD